VVGTPNEPPPPTGAQTWTLTPVKADSPQKPTPPTQTLPPIHHVKKPEVLIEYELKNMGRAGIQTLNLWLTRDDGKTWELHATTEAPRENPLANGRMVRAIELPHEDGVYGIILSAKNRAGMEKAKPRPGDAPQFRLELDMNPPTAQLFKVSFDPKYPNELLLRWKAEDKNLTPRPICLEWAAQRDGPWTPIVQNGENTGSYRWLPPEQSPTEVFLRLRVRDLAGNESIVVTAEAQLIDLREPDIRILGVVEGWRLKDDPPTESSYKTMAIPKPSTTSSIVPTPRIISLPSIFHELVTKPSLPKPR
jgi:hypothetical protein